ncbi:oxidoreductase, partial [Bacillus cereus]
FGKNQFMLDLYDSDKVVGLVDGFTYNYELKNPIFNFAVRKTNSSS